MENRAYALAVGVFTLLLGAGVVFVALWFSGNTEVRDTYTLESGHAVTGLNPQAPVRYRGIEVGRVETIGFAPDSPRKIRVTVSVREGTPITRGTYAQLGSQGVTGLAYVILDDEGDKPQPLSGDQSAQAPIPVRPSYLDEITGAGKTLVTGADDVARRLNQLLSEANQKQLMKTLAGLETATNAIADLARKLDPAVRDLPAVTDGARKALAELARLPDDSSWVQRGLVEYGQLLRKLGKGAPAGSDKRREREHSEPCTGAGRHAGNSEKTVLRWQREQQAAGLA